MSTEIKKDELDLWNSFGAEGHLFRWPREAAVNLGIPYRRAEYLCLKWQKQGKYEYGTNLLLGWKETE